MGRAMKRPDFKFIKRLLALKRAHEADDPIASLQEIQRRLAMNMGRLDQIRQEIELAIHEAHQTGLVAGRLQEWLYTRRNEEK